MIFFDQASFIKLRLSCTCSLDSAEIRIDLPFFRELPNKAELLISSTVAWTRRFSTSKWVCLYCFIIALGVSGGGYCAFLTIVTLG